MSFMAAWCLTIALYADMSHQPFYHASFLALKRNRAADAPLKIPLVHLTISKFGANWCCTFKKDHVRCSVCIAKS